MSKTKKMHHFEGSYLVGIEKHNSGYLSDHRSNNNGWEGYAIVLGILFAAFSALILFS